MIKETRVLDVHCLVERVTDPESPPDLPLDTLLSIVCDLMLEVEALRATVLEMQKTEHAETTGYAKHYRDTAYLTHNGIGPTSGLTKLLQLYYPHRPEKGTPGPASPRAWREVLMLRRLGYSEEEIREFKQDAENSENLS